MANIQMRHKHSNKRSTRWLQVECLERRDLLSGAGESRTPRAAEQPAAFHASPPAAQVRTPKAAENPPASFVAFLPVPPPRAIEPSDEIRTPRQVDGLLAEQILHVKQAESGTITAALLGLEAHDTPTNVTYVITAATSNGVILRSGSPVTSFTQADVNAELITYVHDGSETTSDAFEYTVHHGESTSRTFNIIVVPVDLVAAYSFAEGGGGLINDETGNGNVGTIRGASWTSGRFDNALSFDGIDDLVTVADDDLLDLTTGMTLEAWVKPFALGNVWRDIIFKADDIYYLEGSSTQQGAPTVGGTFTGPLYASSSLPLNTWSHLAATYDGAIVRLFVNGEEVANRSQTGTIHQSNEPLTLGGNDVYGQHWAGLIDEVRIYNRALSQAEIQLDMNTPIGPQTPTAPIAADSTAATSVGEALDGAVNATDDNGDPLTYILVSQVSNGTLVFGSDGSYTYTPNIDFVGADSFTFMANDGGLDSNIATVTISVQEANAAALPELPREYVDTTFAAPTGGHTWVVNAGDDLQATLDAANPGDVIELQAGATFTGNFVLRPKAGDGWLYITTSNLNQLPDEGTRVSPQDAVNMPKLIAPTQFKPALIIEPGVRNVRLVGVEITTAFTGQTGAQYGLLRVGWRENDMFTVPAAESIILDRSFVHGTSTGNVRDGIVSYNVKNWGIVDSYISDFHAVGDESHAIHIFTSPGPTKIANNYVEGAGINLFIGDNDVGGYLPQDIEIVGNHLYKPWSWKPDHAVYAGIPWAVKNLFEIKAAQRVLVDGNIMENVWTGAQHGQAVVITPRGGQIEDVTLRRNVIRNFVGGMNINSADVFLHRVLVEDNLLYTTNGDSLIKLAGTPGTLRDILLLHNTMVAQTNSSWISFNGSREDEVNTLVVRDNLVTHGDYGIHGNDQAIGLPAMDYYAVDYTFRRNAMIGGEPSWYAENVDFGQHFFPNNLAAVGFSQTDFDAISDFLLLPTSPYKSAATDGRDLGANIDALPNP